MFKLKDQIRKLYTSSILGNLSLTGAWVAILSARGFSLVEIGFAETIFHAVSIMFELPSGILADVFGRKKMLLISTLMTMIANTVMIFSNSLAMVCLSVAFNALGYNFASGSGDALAYDSMKLVNKESGFDKYESDQLIIYRVFDGISTLCAGFALTIGYRLAYGLDLVICALQFAVLATLREVTIGDRDTGSITQRLIACIRKSLAFLKDAKRAMGLMLCNSLVGALDILLLFFLQAKLPERGIPRWALGLALLTMSLGGVVGSKLILKVTKPRYKTVFAFTIGLVLLGILAEHSPHCLIMAAGGFLAAVGDDALQVRTNVKLQNMFPSEQRATLTSVESLSFSLIMIVLSPLAGFFFTHW